MYWKFSGVRSFWATSFLTVVAAAALLTPAAGQSSLPVFPGAEGFGSRTVAGRGGAVLRVTNLNDSGPGSLRAALSAAGPRTVIFEISGTISLTTNDLFIDNPYITVAGQTAPSPGITIRGGGIRVRTHDVLIQHLRVRPGDRLASNVLARDSNAFFVLHPAYNVVIDHVTASWGLDQNTSAYVFGYNGTKLHDVTYSNSIMSEGLYNNPLIADGMTRSMALLVGEHAYNLSFIKNLMAHNVKRHPEVKGDTATAIVNNLMYDNRGELMDFYDYDGHGPIKSSIVGNVHIAGPNTGSSPLIYLNASLKPGSQVYQSDNVSPRTVLMNRVTTFNPMVTTPPVSLAGITLVPSSQLEAYLKPRVGARPADRDVVDTRIINEVTNRNGRIITTPGDVGGYPTLAVNVRPLSVPAVPNGDDDRDGYTNLEEWLWTFSAVVEGRTPPPTTAPQPPTNLRIITGLSN